MAALLDKVQPTSGTDTQGGIPRRASRPQAQNQAWPKQGSAPLGRSTSRSLGPACTQTSAPYTQTNTSESLEEDLPQTNPPGRTGNSFKRLTGRLYPYTYRPQSGQTQARGNRWVGMLRWFLSGGWFAVTSRFVTLLVVVYTVVFWSVLGVSDLYNTWSYGPTHTAYLTTTMNGVSSTIQTSNQNGTIYVTIINNQDGSSHTYTGPKLNPDTWNDDMNSIVATASVHPNQKITIHLLGTVNYFRLLRRPEASFSLVPDGQGSYKVVQP